MTNYKTPIRLIYRRTVCLVLIRLCTTVGIMLPTAETCLIRIVLSAGLSAITGDFIEHFWKSPASI